MSNFPISTEVTEHFITHIPPQGRREPNCELCQAKTDLKSRLELREIAQKTLTYCQRNGLKDFNVLDYLKLCDKLNLLSF